MDELNLPAHEGGPGPEAYVPPAVERRASVRDPIVWTVVSSPVICQ